MKKKMHDPSNDPKVQLPHEVRMVKDCWTLTLPGKTKTGRKIIYRCKAASEMGAHRESLLFLAGKL